METEKSISKINYNEVISKDISINSSIFTLILKSSSDSILFELFDKIFSIRISYKTILNLQKLKELHSYFKQFDSIEEVINNLKELI